jgi:two-component system response regulator YesN
MIRQLSPDLVIADIRMPLKSGLEVMKTCREKYGRLPLFILLTSYEEYSYVKEAIGCQAVDYLVKLELTPESMAKSVGKAVDILRYLQKDRFVHPSPGERGGMQQFYDKFFIRLLNHLFENRDQYELQKRELGLDFSFEKYVVCYCEIKENGNCGAGGEKLMKLYSSTLRMVRETVTKFMACYITSLDIRHFAVTFCLSRQEVPSYRKILKNILQKVLSIVYGYFSVKLFCAVGSTVDDPYRLSESFSMARVIFPSVSFENPILFFDSENSGVHKNDVFDISMYREDIVKAFEELDTDALQKLTGRFSTYFAEHPSRSLQAMDAACNLLYTAISMLPDGEKTLSLIFSNEPDGFRCIYRKQTVGEILLWMDQLRDGLCDILEKRKQNYKERLIIRVQKYIRENLNRKLSLNEVAAHFGFSPNYLSQLFLRYSGCSFVEYTTHTKVDAAKKMLAAGDKKIYEVANDLGFENAFYFSKVFKKVEGCSPRDYMKF